MFDFTLKYFFKEIKEYQYDWSDNRSNVITEFDFKYVL